ncbi:MAG TPA: hypothetical protein VGZ52_07125, partial [Acidimicrobiales bacterium]|nr:hypothetical protein [Acidimicrobiales bacterium]
MTAVVAALGFGSWRLRAALLPEWSDARGRLAEVVIALSTFFAVAQLCGAAQLFSSVVLLVAELAAATALATAAPHLARFGCAGGTELSRRHNQKPQIDPREVAAVGVGVAIVVVQWCAHTADAIARGMVHPDTLWYHGPFAAAFVQQHAFTGMDSLGYDAARWFPFNAQVLHAAGILAYGRDVLSPFLNLAWMGLALLAAWCAGRRRHVGHLCVLAAAVGLGLPVMVATQPGQASSDVACAALLLAAVALVLESDLEPVPVALAGLASGLALSTKITIAPAMAVLAVALLLLLVWQRRRAAPLAWTVSLVLTGTFWFGRDWVLAGTPLPWFDLTLGPIHWPAAVPPSAPSLAHDVLHAQAWR